MSLVWWFTPPGRHDPEPVSGRRESRGNKGPVPLRALRVRGRRGLRSTAPRADWLTSGRKPNPPQSLEADLLAAAWHV